MCQAQVYLDEQPIMEDVVWLEPAAEGFLLRALLGEERHVKGKLQGIDLLKHRILLTSVTANSLLGHTEQTGGER